MATATISRPAVDDADRRWSSSSTLKEGCPASTRVMVNNFVRAWLICTAGLTLLCSQLAYQEDGWLGIVGAFIVFGLMLGW